MIVWRKKESKCDRTGGSYSRVLEVGCNKDVGVFVTLNHCYKFKDDDEWKTSHVGELGFYFNPLCSSKKWKWGHEHFWYDGPHCTFGWAAVTSIISLILDVRFANLRLADRHAHS